MCHTNVVPLRVCQRVPVYKVLLHGRCRPGGRAPREMWHLDDEVHVPLGEGCVCNASPFKGVRSTTNPTVWLFSTSLFSYFV